MTFRLNICHFYTDREREREREKRNIERLREIERERVIEEASLYHYTNNLRGQLDRIDPETCTVKLYKTFQSGNAYILYYNA